MERAVLYIEEARKRWGSKLGLSVGMWLYREVYHEDDEYLGSRDPGKHRSLRDIAKRTGKSVRTLRTWVWAGRMKIRLEEQGFSSDRLVLTDWSSLYPLRDMPLAAREVAGWIHDENPTVEEVVERVREWREHGERPPPRKKTRKKAKRRRRRRPYEQNLLRVMKLVHRWVAGAEISGLR